MRTRYLVATAILSVNVFLGGCGGEDDPTEKSISLENALADDSYVTAGTATLTQEGEDVRLLVSAKRGNDDGNQTPFLRADLNDGSSCESFRTYVWSDFTSFQDLMLECEAADVEDVTSASLTE
jgi:hypothetical protein